MDHLRVEMTCARCHVTMLVGEPEAFCSKCERIVDRLEDEGRLCERHWDDIEKCECDRRMEEAAEAQWGEEGVHPLKDRRKET